MSKTDTEQSEIIDIGNASNSSLATIYFMSGFLIIMAIFLIYWHIIGLAFLIIGIILLILQTINTKCYINKIKHILVYRKKIIPFENIKTLFIMKGIKGENIPPTYYIVVMLKNKTFLKILIGKNLEDTNVLCLKLCDIIKVPCSSNKEGRIDFSYIIEYALKESRLNINYIHTIVGDKNHFTQKVAIIAIMKDNSRKNLIDITGIEFHKDILDLIEAIRIVCKSHMLIYSYDSNNKLIRKNLKST